MQLYKQIKKLGACQPALNWIEANPGMTLEEAWQKCSNGKWMIWLLQQSNSDIPIKAWQYLAYDLAASVMHLMPTTSQGCMAKIKAYLDGDITITTQDVRRPADANAAVTAADATNDAVTAAYATNAADAAADAVTAVCAVDAVTAADAVSVYAYAAAARAAVYDYVAAAVYTADAAAIVRKYFPQPPAL